MFCAWETETALMPRPALVRPLLQCGGFGTQPQPTAACLSTEPSDPGLPAYKARMAVTSSTRRRSTNWLSSPITFKLSPTARKTRTR